MMPALPVSDIDVLYVDSLGKNYSGTGMDTNVIGRFRILGVEEPESPAVKYIVVGDVSEESHGNALGVGLADLTTQRLAGPGRTQGHERQRDHEHVRRAGQGADGPG